jgi:hypothetical protein
MSESDEVLSVGKTVLAYIASKRKLATLQADIARIAQQFEENAAALRERGGDPAICNQFIGMPTYESMRVLTDDLRAETRRHAELLKSIKAIGLEG